MEEKLIELISEYQGIPKEKISLDSKLVNDLGLSSYDLVDLTCKIEETFDIEVPDNEIKNLVKISDVIEVIKKRE